MNTPDKTIRMLVDDLTPTGGPIRTGRCAVAWLIVTILVTAVCMALIQPFRPGVIEQFLATPRFTIEILLGLVVCIGLAHAAFRLGIPDTRSPRRRARVSLVMLAIWLGLFAFAILAPVFPSSNDGERPLCFLEVLVYALPFTIAGLVIVRRWMPLDAAGTGAWMGFAAGLIPAWLMQLACMHAPLHNLYFHLAPTLGTAVVGAWLGMWLLRRR